MLWRKISATFSVPSISNQTSFRAGDTEDCMSFFVSGNACGLCFLRRSSFSLCRSSFSFFRRSFSYCLASASRAALSSSLLLPLNGSFRMFGSHAGFSARPLRSSGIESPARPLPFTSLLSHRAS